MTRILAAASQALESGRETSKISQSRNLQNEDLFEYKT